MNPKLSEPEQPSRVRWKMLVLLVGFSVTAYVLRVNITIAEHPLMQETHLAPVQLGWIFSSFLVTYTVFMTPAGMFLDRYGPRFILAVAALIWAVLAFGQAITPNLVFTSTWGIIISLMVLRGILGAAQSPTFPGGAKAISQWFPNSERAFANGWVQTGGLLGTAVTAPLISYLMVHLGWRHAMIVTSLMAPALVLIWLYYGTDRPEQHRGVNAAELAWIRNAPATVTEHKPTGPDLKLIVKSMQAWKLTLAYSAESYASYMFIWWVYYYLVEVRKFSVLGSGILASIPFIVATITTPLAGGISDRLSLRFGHRQGRRIVPIVTLLSAAVLVYFGGIVPGPKAAVIILSLGAALTLAAEGPTWASMSEMSGASAGAATGFLNTGSNLGGFFSTLLTPWIAGHYGWPVAFGVASFFSVAAAALWFGIDATSRITHEPASEIGQG
ncbi:MAG: MFS transporter [Terriglobia bacterium]|jgi:ACS family glucarate transporter-like MFS transporter